MGLAMAKKRIIGVIGLGHVGAHVAYALAVQGIADELILIDKTHRSSQAKYRICAMPQRISRTASAFRPGSFPISANAT